MGGVPVRNAVLGIFVARREGVQKCKKRLLIGEICRMPLVVSVVVGAQVDSGNEFAFRFRQIDMKLLHQRLV